MPLTDEEKKRLTEGLRAAFAIPFIDDIEDYIWEAIFAYARDLPLPDPLVSIRSKRLFDVIDAPRKVGWSCKALQWAVAPGRQFELVIQRADIFKKARLLGYRSLNRRSPTHQLGEALLRHWYGKVNEDAKAQGVKERRVAFLIKTRNRKRFAYYESALRMFQPHQLRWEWTDSTKTGLQGRMKDGFCVYRWYPNQKQFFERFALPKNTPISDIRPERLPVRELVELILSRLPSRS